MTSPAAAAAAAGAAAAGNTAQGASDWANGINSSLAQQIAAEMAAAQQAGGGDGGPNGGSFFDAVAATARAEAQWQQAQQQKAQQEAAARAAAGRAVLDDKFPYLFGNSQQQGVTTASENSPWFNRMIGLGDPNQQGQGQPSQGNGINQASGMAGLLGVASDQAAQAQGGSTATPASQTGATPVAQSAADAAHQAAMAATGNLPEAQNGGQTSKTGQGTTYLQQQKIANTPPNPADDPVLKQYGGLVQQYEQQQEGPLYQGTGATGMGGLMPNGNVGTSSTGSSSSTNPLDVTYSTLGTKGFGFVLIKDPKTGKLTTESAATAYENLSVTALHNPTEAAQLMTTLAAMGAYTGTNGNYVESRLYLKNGVLQGAWGKDDITALANGLQMATQEQVAQYNATGNPQSLQDILSTLGQKNQGLAVSTGGALGSTSTSSSSKSYGSRSYSSSASTKNLVTDPAIIQDQANNTAAGMIGRHLSPEELAAFTSYYQQLEASGKYSMSYASVGIPGEAQAWIQQHLGGDYQSQQYANFYDGLISLFQNGMGGIR